MKGAFGGGFSIVGIPLLSFVMDPVTAGGLLAPLFITMDLFALRSWKPSTWSKPDLVLLFPGLVTGMGLGYLLFRVLDHRVVAIVMAVVTLIFVGLFAIPAGVWLGWRLHGRLDQQQIVRACYGLLVVTALKLRCDGVSGYLA